MALCWETRGCDDEMQSRCPHNTPGESCPADCHYAACLRETHIVATDVTVLLNPDLDYEAAIRQVCRFCEFFLTHGPRFDESVERPERTGNPNRFLL